jgi:hypothetical protein
VISSRSYLCRSALVAAAALAAMAVPAVSSAARSTVSSAAKSTVPCWKQLLNEWYGGSITTIYAHSCYQEAINHLPTDISEYSSAKQDIQAAELAATKNRPAPKETSTVPNLVGPATASATTTTGRKKKHGIAGFFADLTPGSPQAFPLPLLVLGALAIVLVLAGGAGMIWQRTHPSDEDTA